MLQIPSDVKRIEHPMATFWWDDAGILYSVSKPGARTIEIMTEYIDYVKKMIGENPVCILTDISKAGPMDKATREFTASQLQYVYKAMAILAETPGGSTIGKIFLQHHDQPYPLAMFSDVNEAKEWLKGYL